MSLLRVPLEGLAPGRCALPGPAAEYATRVHRLAKGDRFVAFDPALAVECDAEIVEVGRRAVTVELGEARPAATRARRAITLIQSVCKGDKMDAIVRDATELGATRVVPAIAERSVARPDASRAERWRRIAVEAARQSGRGDAPAIAAPVALAEALAERGDAAGICLDPLAEMHLGEALPLLAAAGGLVVVIGPEGGLTEGEIAAAVSGGYQRATLGPIVLRAETVCAAVLGGVLIAGGRS